MNQMTKVSSRLSTAPRAAKSKARVSFEQQKLSVTMGRKGIVVVASKQSSNQGCQPFFFVNKRNILDVEAFVPEFPTN